MSMDSATIAIVSGGRITLTSPTLTYYEGIAVEVLERDDPGFGSATYDRALALLICHFAAADLQGDLETKSESRGGDWSFSKDPGTTTYLIQYRGLLEQFASSYDVPTEGIVRGDATMNGPLLDLIDLPTFTDDEEAGTL
jgi:hypothetical protein